MTVVTSFNPTLMQFLYTKGNFYSVPSLSYKLYISIPLIKRLWSDPGSSTPYGRDLGNERSGETIKILFFDWTWLFPSWKWLITNEGRVLGTLIKIVILIHRLFKNNSLHDIVKNIKFVAVSWIEIFRFFGFILRNILDVRIQNTMWIL